MLANLTPNATAGTVWDVARAVADWWDAVELWLTQLPFPLQVVLAVLVLLPACWAGAAGAGPAVGRGRRAARRAPGVARGVIAPPGGIVVARPLLRCSGLRR